MKLFNEENPAPNPRRVRMFMAEKGISIPLVHVPMRDRAHKSPEFVAKNSLGILTSGFGVVNVYQAPNSATIFTGNTGPRSGTIIARFSF